MSEGLRQRLAFDRSSGRSRDEDGRLRVQVSNISKANICPYQGNTIPRWRELSLDPNKIYRLFRDPDELARAAPTFNDIQVLDVHIPVSSKDPRKESVAGTTGSNTFFEAPYLKTALTFWDEEAIVGIENEEQCELSSSYRYDADMTPGTYQGLRYDGIMRNIRGNHVALVREGRAGPDVVVGDQKMSKALTSRAALMLKGAIGAYLAPLLATDAKVDLNGVLEGVTAANFSKMQRIVAKRLAAETTGKLAADAKLDAPALALAFDAMEEACDEDDDDMEGGMDEEEKKVAADKKAKDEAEKKAAADKKAKDEADMTEAEKKGAADKKAKDEAEKKAAEDKRAKDEADEDKREKAMDSMRTDLRSQIVADFRAMDEARALVRPLIGELAADSTLATAEEILIFALDSVTDVDARSLKGTPLDGLKAMIRLVPAPGSPTARASGNAFAHDSKPSTMFPAMGRFRTAA